jgi:signal transduction histidine kinase
VVAPAALRLSRGVIDRVLQTGEMVAVADIVGNEELSTRKSILDLGLRSVLCAPIRFGGRRLGILYLDSRRVGSLLSEKDLGLLSAFAALAGSALENSRLIADLRRKTELLAHMAHEFRSPLQGITGYAELARQDQAMGPRARRGLEVITAQAKRLAKIVDRTLEMSRMEAGAVKLRRDRIDPGEVAAAAIEGLDPLARMKSMRVVLDRDADAPQVIGDFDRLVQVVTNLVGNAIQYSPDASEVAVRIAGGEPLSARMPGGRTAQIIVSDRGPGIPDADVEKLFTPFFRGGGGTGTGLGLVISREIVRQHGGEIAVRSRPGTGTIFTIVLPEAP